MKQRAYAREQRALLVLRRAAVRFTNAIDAGDMSREAFLSTNLDSAAMKYANTLNGRDRRRLSK